MFAMTAAHKTLPLPCYARVTNLSNGRSVVVRINDRGPFVDNRIIDLSYTAAAKLDMIRNGTAFVQRRSADARSPGTDSVPASIDTGSSSGQHRRQQRSARSPVSPRSSTPAAPAPATAAPRPMPRACADQRTSIIQVGAYSRPTMPMAWRASCAPLASSMSFTLAPSANQPLQRVRVGPIESVQQFDALIARLSALGFPSARLAQD